jgi:DNA-directed RNA polymerase delta subunit
MSESIARKDLTPSAQIEAVIRDVLNTIEKEREREIVSRRFGLFDRKETLEQIGELLGITRERVRQLEKSAVARLSAEAEKDLPYIVKIQDSIVGHLKQMGNVAKISDLTEKLIDGASKIDQARVSFIARLCPQLSTLDDNDYFHHTVALATSHTEKSIREHVSKVVDSIKAIGLPTTIPAVAEKMEMADHEHVKALASASKHVAHLNGLWGLVKWPMVNPKNIRDKIYVILHENGKHMHFNEIAASIKDSSFKRKNVTTQAIHNELIKDKRFVLIGRGIYALKEWGYEKGTVADMISSILKKEGKALHRDEIVKRVLKHRFVKETTILLNLQGKPQFKRVAKATYALAE